MRRRATPIKPIKPEPSSQAALGTGTGALVIAPRMGMPLIPLGSPILAQILRQSYPQLEGAFTDTELKIL